MLSAGTDIGTHKTNGRTKQRQGTGDCSPCHGQCLSTGASAAGVSVFAPAAFQAFSGNWSPAREGVDIGC